MMIIKILGEHIDDVKNIFFDYTQAVDSLKFFNYKDVPAINIANVPAGVANVHFQSDLSNIKPIESEIIEGQLHKSLGL